MPYSITFSATEPGSVPILGWTINWGDGVIDHLASDAAAAVHTYTASANLNVKAYVVDKNGSTQAPALAVAVSYGAGTVVAGGPYKVAEGGSLTLTANAGGSPISYSWDLNGDGVFGDVTSASNTIVVPWATLQGLNPPINDSGTINNVAVRVTYPGNATATSAATTLTVTDVAPTATLSAGTPILQGGTATATFSNPFSPSAGETASGFTYSFDFGNTGSFQTVGASPSATVPAALLGHSGTLVVRGRITDHAGGYTDYFTNIIIKDVTPTVTAGANQIVDQGTIVQLAPATFTDPGFSNLVTGSILTYHANVSWGDGTSSIGTVVSTNGGPGVLTTGTVAASHPYPTPGNYTVTVTVTDDSGASGQGTFSVTVNKAATKLTNFYVPPTFTPGLPVQLNATSNTPGLTYTWTITQPDHSTVTLFGNSPTFDPAQTGAYTVKLIVAPPGGGPILTQTAIVSSAFITVIPSGSDLQISDLTASGKADDLKVSFVGGKVVINDPTQAISVAVTGAVGNGTNTVTVPLAARHGSVFINALSGNDTIDLLNSVAGTPVVIQAGPGKDIFNLGGTLHQMATLQGPVTVNGTAGAGEALNLNDQGTTTGQTYTITAASISRAARSHRIFGR